MNRFSLERGKWYACELIGDDFTEAYSSDLCSYSPIKVTGVFPLHSSNRKFRLEFYHANYPEGVQNKDYTLRTIERGKNFILARSDLHNPQRVLQIYEISAKWITTHFPDKRPDRENVQEWLNQNA